MTYTVAKKTIIAFAMLFVLTGCFIPEKFHSTVKFSADGAYTFHYDGTVIFALAAAQIKSVGQLQQKDNDDLQKLVIDIKKDKCVKDASYIGNARYHIYMDCTFSSGNPYNPLGGIIKIETEKDGVVVISSPAITEKNIEELRSLGIEVNGTLKIDVPSGINILSENADSKPILGFGGYAWKLGRVDQRPMMRLKF